mgnify:CR=1 FL=1
MNLGLDLIALRPLLLAVCCSSAMLTIAQDKPKKPQTKVILYKDRMAAAFDTVDCVKNVIKLNPLLFFRGEVPVYFERALTPRLSVEVGVGVTTRNYLNFSFAGDEPDDFGAATEIIARPTFHFGARYYTTDDLEPQGWYWEIALAHLSYVKDIRTKDSTGQITDVRLRDQRIYNDVRLMTGYQMLSGTSNWLFDIYGGVGLRDRSLEKVEEDHNLETGIRIYTIEKVSDAVPVFFLGVKVGWGF